GRPARRRRAWRSSPSLGPRESSIGYGGHPLTGDSFRQDDERAWELRRNHPSVGHRPRMPRFGAGPTAGYSLGEIAQAGALPAPWLEIPIEAAIDHLPRIEVAAGRRQPMAEPLLVVGL